MNAARPFVVAALMLSMFLSAMEATVVATAMPTVVSDLGGLAVYGWVGAAYLLAATVTVPLFGKLSDRQGRKPVLLTGIALFLFGSLACGLATSIEQLILFRAIQGLGAGAMQPTVLTVIGDLYTPEERGRVQGLFSAVWGFAGIAGPLIGGGIVAVASWRWVFLLNVPFGLAAAAVLWRVYHEAPRAPARAPLDVVGGFALLMASLSVLLAASRVAPLFATLCGVAFVALFVAIEQRAPDPVLPLGLLSNRRVAVTAGASCLLGAAMTGTVTYLPLHVQGVLARSPTEAGVAVAPMLVGWPIAAAMTSRVLTKVGYRPPIWLGSAIILVSTAALVPLVSGRVEGPGVALAMLAFGFGMGFANSALIIGVQASVGWEQRGVVTAITMFSRTMGGALGTGALGALLAARLEGAVPAETVRQLLDPHGPVVPASQAVVDALGAALDPVFWAGASCAAASLALVGAYPREALTAGTTPAPPPATARTSPPPPPAAGSTTPGSPAA